MTTFLTITFSIIAIGFYLGVVTEMDAHARKCDTIGFAICAAVVLAVNVMGGVL